MRIYERLSQVYDIDWGRFAQQYSGLMNQVLGEYGINQARVLDLACGTGILAVMLAAHGHIVHGMDNSPEMVALATSKSMGMANISFEIQDMTRFVVSDEFDLVTCTFDSVNYVVSVVGLEAMFRRVSRCLRESGLFLFDSNTNQLYVSVGSGSQKKELGGQSFVQRWSYDPVKKEATTVFEFADGSKEIHRQRPYDLSELGPILAECGLDVVQTWSWFDRRPYNAQSARLFCVAMKRV
jgi:SAM-dependent methyltransferase